jgi:FAD/FMN-containing dehydrogenase
MMTMTSGALDPFRASLRGQLIEPHDAAYDGARALWNAMIDRRPALIARCLGVADVMAALAFARAHGLPLAVRGGGHNIAGSALCDQGLVIDLSAMRGVRIDARARRAQVDGGATLRDLDHEAQAFGLATPLGINSTTGVAGLTLGGGFGWLSRRFGMTIDNLLAADVVTADGRLPHTNAEQHPELFWALRGGGGNFGVITRFEFALHPVGPQVTAGLVVFPQAEAQAVLRRYRALAATLDNATTVWAVLRQAPPLPFLAPAHHGSAMLALALCSTQPADAAAATLARVRALGTPIGEHVGAVPYTAWQQAFDALLVPGARNYWKSHNFTALGDDAIDTMVAYAGTVPTGQCEIFLAQMGGKVGAIGAAATAYPHRDAQYVLNVHTRWDDAADDARCIGWARDFFDAAAPHASGGVYVNFLTDDERERVAQAYGGNLARLARVKREFDPQNLFRSNQNIAPAA